MDSSGMMLASGALAGLAAGFMLATVAGDAAAIGRVICPLTCRSSVDLC
jgi:hypothetical protein